LRKIDLIWAASGWRRSELRKYKELAQNPNQFLQEDRSYLTVGEIFLPKSSRRGSKRVRDSQLEDDIKIYGPGQCSNYSESLRSGRFGIRNTLGAKEFPLSIPIKTRPGANIAPSTMRNGAFS